MSDESLDITGDPAQMQNPEVQRVLSELRTLSETTILLDRMRWANLHGLTFEGLRDEYRILGYPRAVTYKDYREEYDRGGVAGRIIDVMPDACWRGDPAFEIIEDENPENETEFEKAWLEVATKHQIIPKLIRSDKLSRLSTYSVVLIGARGNNLEEPLPKATGIDSLLYLMPFSGGGGPGANDNRTVAGDASAMIREYEEDPSNERFGLPKSYQLKRIDVTSSALLRPVHWTRIVHIAEGVLEDEVYGQPALQRVWNLLIDLRKVTGGGAEAFWLRANQGMHLNIDKDMALPQGDDTIERLKEQSELYKHQLTRWLRTRGVEVKTLGSDVANFDNPADAILTQIAGAKAIPKRILTGSEMGELASSQDRENFKDQIIGRQLAHCGPNIVRPLVDRLIEFGYLPTPKGGPREYQVSWPHIQVLTEDEKSKGALAWSQTKIGEDPVFTDAEIRDKWYGMAPLTTEQFAEIDNRKMEAVKRQQEAMITNAPEDEDEDEEEEDEKELLKAAEDSEMVRVLAAAIAAGDTDIIDQITGVERPAPQVVIDPKTIAEAVIPHIAGQVKRYGLVPRMAGGSGSGNFGHSGRPGQVGGSSATDTIEVPALVAYHGTTDEAWASIQKEGLVPHGGTGADELANVPEFVIGEPGSERRASVYMTDDPSMAASFADFVAGEQDLQPLILKINVPRDQLNKVKFDTQFRVGMRFAGEIPPAWIEKTDLPVAKLKREMYMLRPRRRRAAEEAGLTLYAVVVVDTGELVTAGGPGSGNFGHAGRPGEIGGSATAESVESRSERQAFARAEYDRLKSAWAVRNNEAFKYVEKPDSPEAKKLLDEMKAITKEIHTLDADPGGIEGLYLPGGPKDVVIVGGGPAGLSASMNAAAEGYDTLLVESNEQVGGQARQSTRIENLPGFPLGVSGQRLASDMEAQALRLGSQHKTGTKVVGIDYNEETGNKIVRLSNGESIEARTVILAGGLSQVTHAQWDNGTGDVSYVQPEKVLADARPGVNMAVAGGSNGAAQAAIAAATNGADVTLVSRSELEKSMSAYQIVQVRNHPKINSIVGDIKKHENGVLTLGGGRTVAAEKVGVFYGARPDTSWMPDGIKRDEQGRVRTSPSGDYSTSMRGVFAVGDVTTTGVGRIGIAIGEGQNAIKGLHPYFQKIAQSLGRSMPQKRAAMRAMAADITTKKRASDVRAWYLIVDQAFALDDELPWYGQTIEGEKPPKRPTYLSREDLKTAGGPGSGNFGHSGRPGQVGGSAQSISAVPVVKKNSRIISRIQGPKDADLYAELPVQQEHRFRNKPQTPVFEVQREGLPFGYGDAVSNIQGPIDPNPRAELPVRESSLLDPNYTSIETPVEINATDAEPMGDGSNLNEVLRITTTTGDEVVFKPRSGEHFYSPERDDNDDVIPESQIDTEYAELVRKDVSNTDAPMAEREVLAYRVDEELGLGIVPHTVYGEYEGREGSAQTFIENAREGAYEAHARDTAKMGVLDAVIGNQDRHTGNALTKDRQLVAIDHGLAFGTVPPGGYIRSWALAGIGPDDLPVPEQKAMADRLDKFDFSKVLKGAHLDDREVETFRERVALIANRLRLGEAHLIKSDFDTSAW